MTRHTVLHADGQREDIDSERSRFLTVRETEALRATRIEEWPREWLAARLGWTLCPEDCGCHGRYTRTYNEDGFATDDPDVGTLTEGDPPPGAHSLYEGGDDGWPGVVLHPDGSMSSPDAEPTVAGSTADDGRHPAEAGSVGRVLRDEELDFFVEESARAGIAPGRAREVWALLEEVNQRVATLEGSWLAFMDQPSAALARRDPDAYRTAREVLRLAHQALEYLHRNSGR